MDTDRPVSTIDLHFSNEAYALSSFYAALNGYVDYFSPTPGDALGRSYAHRSPESWLEVAHAIAHQITASQRDLLQIIEAIKALVARREFASAYTIIYRGMSEADQEIRKTRARR